MTTTTTPTPASGPLSGGPDQRARIIDVAFSLMSRNGASATSMRRLATACGLNVATIYHYFPSKADLLRAVIEQRRYGARLAVDPPPPVDKELPPQARLEVLLSWLWQQTEGEQEVLRLIVGEGSRGDTTAQASARSLIAVLDAWLEDLLAEGFPELTVRTGGTEAVARVVRRHLLGLVAQLLTTGEADADAAAADLAEAVFS